MPPPPQSDFALRIARRASRWSMFTTLCVCLAVPVAYLSNRYVSEMRALDAELKLDRVLAERVINRDPEFWRFKGERLQAVIESHVVASKLPLHRRVLDLQGQVVTEFGEALSPPVVRRTLVLRESVRPVGTLEMGVSLRPLGIEFGLVTLGMTLLAGVALLILQRFAIRPLQQIPADLAASEAARRLASRALDAATNPFVVVSATTPDYPIEYVNPAFEQLTGYPLAEVKGCNCRFLQGEDREQPALEEIRNALAAQRSVLVRLRNYRKDGTMFWNELNIAPVLDVQGRVSHFVGEMVDITERLRASEQLRFQATHDPLTGLANRRMLTEQLTQAIAQANRFEQRLSVAYIDLDSFKFVNDSLGHEAGDQLLTATAQRLAACVREVDLLARVGGDEFVLVLHGHASDAAAYETLRRIQTQLCMPVWLDRHEFRMSGSIGVAAFPSDGRDAETLLRNADLAMYRAKQAERGSIQFYASEMHDRIQQRLVWEQDLRAALERNELLLHYQPQVSLQDGHIVGVEALLRWQHPQHGLVSPAQFIPLSEELGLIDSIGQWVMLTACRQGRAWQLEGLEPGTMAVNVSAYQFVQPGFVATVAAAIAETGIDPAALELEITESASMHDPQETVRILRALKQMGVRLAIDDFGTGYSNLGYLSQFPLDKLKLDQSFMRKATHEPRDLAICEATVALAHSLGLYVIAEGVESEAQLALLARIGCEDMQGYLFSRPLTPEACAELLRSGRHLPVTHLHEHSAQPTVLLVDDDPAVRRSFELAMQGNGTRSLTAADPDQAYDILACQEVGVVISDQHMPGEDGISFFSHIKQMYPGTVRILLTADDAPEMLSNAINRGEIYRFLTKPVRLNQFADVVKEALQHQKH